MKVLIIAEHDNKTSKSANSHVVSAALKLAAAFDVLVIGANCGNVANKLTEFSGVNQVIVADNAVYEHQLAENTAALVADIGKNYDYILTGATTFGKNLLPRVAALLDMSLLSDVTEIKSPDTFVRPIYAGNVMATVQTSDKIKLMTIRTTAFPAASTGQPADGKIATVQTVIPNESSKFEKQTLTVSSRPELTSARIVVSGGRGLKSAENFKLIESLADSLGAAVGASRAAVDAGFAPNDYQVGQTGKVVAPDLYIAIGISGAIQHLAGMKDSKIIVAINSDPDAPIFQVADYSLVGDLFTLLPEIQAELDKVL